VKQVILPLSSFIILQGCGPVAYQPKPITYDKMPIQQQIVQYEANNPFIRQYPLQAQQVATAVETELPVSEEAIKIDKKQIKKQLTPKQTQAIVSSPIFAPQIQLGVSASKYASQISGMNYEQCGIAAVVVSINNQSAQPVYVDITQFSATTAMGEMQPYMPIDVVNIAMNSEGFNQAIKGAAEGAFAGATGGAIVGGLVAVALGLKFEHGARLGAVSGGIGGVGGGAQGYRQKFSQAMSSEVESKKFMSRNIYPNTTVTGVLFFPNEITGLKLHLPTKTVNIVLNAPIGQFSSVDSNIAVTAEKALERIKANVKEKHPPDEVNCKAGAIAPVETSTEKCEFIKEIQTQ